MDVRGVRQGLFDDMRLRSYCTVFVSVPHITVIDALMLEQRAVTGE
jgi:hypothetical protein